MEAAVAVQPQQVTVPHQPKPVTVEVVERLQSQVLR
jgi:hypothetical protein